MTRAERRHRRARKVKRAAAMLLDWYYPWCGSLEESRERAMKHAKQMADNMRTCSGICCKRYQGSRPKWQVNRVLEYSHDMMDLVAV